MASVTPHEATAREALTPERIDIAVLNKLAKWFNALPDGSLGKEHFDGLCALVSGLVPRDASQTSGDGEVRVWHLGSSDDPESLLYSLSIASMATPCRDYQGSIYFAHNDQYPDAEFRDFGLARAFRVICNNAKAILSALSIEPPAVGAAPMVVIDHGRDADGNSHREIRNAVVTSPEPVKETAGIEHIGRAEVTELIRAARYILPYLRFTIGDESPGHHPTMPSAVAAFEEAFGFAGKTSSQLASAALQSLSPPLPEAGKTLPYAFVTCVSAPPEYRVEIATKNIRDALAWHDAVLDLTAPRMPHDGIPSAPPPQGSSKP